MLTVTIPGEPIAQGRPRAYVNRRGKARVYDPARSRTWKGVARWYMAAALGPAQLPRPVVAAGPVELRVVAVFTCPRSHYPALSSGVALPRRLKASKPDAENVAKAVMDAGTGVLYTDDAQVVRLIVEKWIGAQGEAPGVTVTVRAM